jgi:hypothetical protein
VSIAGNNHYAIPRDSAGKKLVVVRVGVHSVYAFLHLNEFA